MVELLSRPSTTLATSFRMNRLPQLFSLNLAEAFAALIKQLEPFAEGQRMFGLGTTAG